MRNDNTNLQPPNFAPTLPTYPVLEQECRVYAGGVSLSGRTYYPAFTQQFTPPLGLRDREESYVFEANSLPLQPGIYSCRLVGNLLGLPLFVTVCCPVGSSSSSAHA